MMKRRAGEPAAGMSPGRRRAAVPIVARRDLLRVGSVALSAAAWPGMGLLSPRRAAAGDKQAAAQPPATAQAVIVLWMAGGVTHFESFDPKPEAPAEVRGTLETIDTRLPGVRFAEVMPCLAGVADKLAVLRSYSHDNNDHFMSQAYALSGRKVPANQILTEPNVGAVVSCLHGPRNQLPGYITVPGITRPGPPPHNLFVGGWLGAQHAPFAVGGEPAEPDFTVTAVHYKTPPEIGDEDLTPPALALPADAGLPRLGSRAGLRAALDEAARRVDRQAAAALDSQYSSAVSLLTSPRVRQAFDLGLESDAVREAYGRTKIGGRCLLARRLVEAGAHFVMVDYGYDPHYGNLWDNHAVPVQNQPHICEMARRPYHVAGMDRAFGALVADLHERGLLASTLVVFLTEFGRTPKINEYGGRDHWGPAGSLFFAGGGTRGGQVIGATDKQGAYPVTRPYSPADVAATIYRALGINTSATLYDLQNRPLPVLPEGEAIAEVLG